MSLINEALRKARLEAARQEAARRGLSYPAGEPAPRRLPLVPILAVVALVALAATLVYWLAIPPEGDALEVATTAVAKPAAPGSSGTAPSGDAGDTAAPAAPVAIATIAVDPPTPRPVIEPAPGRERPSPSPATDRPQPAASPPARPRPTERRSEPSPAATPAAPDRRTAPAGEAPPVEEPAAVVNPAPLDPPPAAGETFVGEAAIPGVGVLKLGGIAWSERQPFALINGRVVGPGDSIQGLQVDSVGRAQVVLRADGGALYTLRLR